MSGRSFLILHGWQGSGPEHWQTWLDGRLRERGEHVRYPGLPRPNEPRFEEWLAALRGELAAMAGERVVVCHSLACVLWLRHAAGGAGPTAGRVLLVAPPAPEAELPGVEGFFPLDASAEDVRRAAGSTRLVCGTGDPYCPAGADAVYGRPLELATDVLAGGAHLNVDAGYGPWPAVERWCLDAEAPVGGR